MTNIVRPARKFIVSSVSSDAHMWNLVFLQLLLEEHGGEVRNLGACVPDQVIIDECRKARPDVLVLSTVNGHGHIDGLRLIKKIRSEPDLKDLRVVIGGKLGVRGAENVQFIEGLAEGGFDGVFESEGGLRNFQEFLGLSGRPAPRALPRPRPPVRVPGTEAPAAREAGEDREAMGVRVAREAREAYEAHKAREAHEDRMAEALA
ncbi:MULTISPECIES: cobalamin B12-binding domain-containing protein [Streptomyces]|uniref:Methylaspartate mutase subunit S n=4 Tax=Streptomyces TaxID=1883 RepID=A0A1D8G250_9ACTN|nr:MULTISPECIES: cobalamin-dependent protein [Streptomyces]AOT59529.1 methylaspartate mutase subunit S [Streptomyces rubrolavendulae]OSY52163.1 methylaspartate mutase subunit S [Streptomyces fradiae ATCC 10745 = DSM 40063]QEV12767.1 methylmalonyl-CoA mutase [Streptomyces fradiae ATCC 10745 = DSM 40063]UQS31977.1 cobalamin-dependent protein [Streptomyces fradiae]